MIAVKLRISTQLHPRLYWASSGEQAFCAECRLCWTVHAGGWTSVALVEVLG